MLFITKIIAYFLSSCSQYWRSGLGRCQVLPSFLSVADARQAFPSPCVWNVRSFDLSRLPNGNVERLDLVFQYHFCSSSLVFSRSVVVRQSAAEKSCGWISLPVFGREERTLISFVALLWNGLLTILVHHILCNNVLVASSRNSMILDFFFWRSADALNSNLLPLIWREFSKFCVFEFWPTATIWDAWNCCVFWACFWICFSHWFV